MSDRLVVTLTDESKAWADDYATHGDEFTSRRHQSDSPDKNAKMGYRGEAAWRQEFEVALPEWVPLRGQMNDPLTYVDFLKDMSLEDQAKFDGDRDIFLGELMGEVKTTGREGLPFYVRPSKTNPEADLHGDLGLWAVQVSDDEFWLRGWLIKRHWDKHTEWDDFGFSNRPEVRTYCGKVQDTYTLIDHYFDDQCSSLSSWVRS